MVSLNLFCLGSAEFLEPKFISFTKFGELGVIFFPKHIFCTNLSSSSWTPNTQMSNLLRVHTPCGSIPFFKKIFFFSLLFRLDVSIFNSLTLYVVICILTLSQMLFFHICRHMHEKRLSLFITGALRMPICNRWWVSIRVELEAWVEELGGGHGKVISLGKLRPSGLDFNRPVAASPPPQRGSLPLDQ